MRRSVCIIFATFAFFLGNFVQLVAQNATPVSNFTYMINIDCTGIIISGYSGSEKDVVIPSTIENYPVVELSTGVFFENNYLESITIPNSVKKIGGLTFSGCTKLKTVNIGTQNIEYTKEVSAQIRGRISGMDVCIDLSGNEAFMGCRALSLEEQKKIRHTGYRGRF